MVTSVGEGDPDAPAGSGGVAGKGGIISVEPTVIVNAYNGNKYTDGTSYENGANQCRIYAQDGIYLKVAYGLLDWSDAKNTYFSALLGRTINFTKNINGLKNYSSLTVIREYNATGCAFYKQGIGSGAGFLELSNGSYKINGIEQVK